MKTILYKSGKFYGYEKPEAMPETWIEPQSWIEAHDSARANALEIENPEVAFEKTCKWDGNKDACGNEVCWDLIECQKNPTLWKKDGQFVKYGELYPWDGEVERIEETMYENGLTETDGGMWVKEQLKLLPKQKETSLDQNDFDTEEEFFKACREQRKGGIVATGEPEQGECAAHQILHALKLSIGQDVNEYAVPVINTIIKNHESAELDSLRDQLANAQEIISNRESFRARIDSLERELAKTEQELAKAKEENKQLQHWKDSMMEIWGPIIDFMQDSKNYKALGLRPGDLLSEKILEMLKNKVG